MTEEDMDYNLIYSAKVFGRLATAQINEKVKKKEKKKISRLFPAFPFCLPPPLPPPSPPPFPPLLVCSSVGAVGVGAAAGYQVVGTLECPPVAPGGCVCSGRPSPRSSSECASYACGSCRWIITENSDIVMH